jgi:hypothetical protein
VNVPREIEEPPEAQPAANPPIPLPGSAALAALEAGWDIEVLETPSRAAQGNQDAAPADDRPYRSRGMDALFLKLQLALEIRDGRVTSWAEARARFEQAERLAHSVVEHTRTGDGA